jgi:hypothetical protein
VFPVFFLLFSCVWEPWELLWELFGLLGELSALSRGGPGYPNTGKKQEKHWKHTGKPQEKHRRNAGTTRVDTGKTRRRNAEKHKTR